jgi:hypothetical protein
MGRGRRLGGVFAGTLVAILVAWSPLAAQPVFATGPLRVQAATTYSVDPNAGLVHVAVAYALTNNKPGSATILYFYRTLNLGVQADARSVRAADSVGSLAVSAVHHASYTEVTLRLRANLYYQRTTAFTLRYDLVGGKPRSDTPVRVGQAFVTFGVWAFGDDGEGSVEVRMPPGFTTSVEGDDLTTKASSSGAVLKASPSKPSSFFAVVSGEDRAAFDAHHLSMPGGVGIVVLSWPEDKRWEQSVSRTLVGGFPKLQELVGLDWPVTHDLTVREQYTPSLEGYAGLFFVADQRIDVSEDIDPVTILHEASHAWFNDHLFDARWIYEGLAEEYAWQVLTATGGDAQPIPKAPTPSDPGSQPLTTWTFPQVIRDQDTSDSEEYGYKASFWVMHQIVRAVGVDQMRKAFAAADQNVTAYPGAGAPETVAATDDWRRFLDLVEPIEGTDPASVEAAMRDVVTSPAAAQSLANRAEARTTYRALVAAGDGWAPPLFVRELMASWTFTDAEARMAAATSVLALRDQVASEAAAEALRFDTTSLETAYEGATSGFDPVTTLAQHDLAAIEAIAGAHAAVDASSDVVAQVGLLGEAPRAGYDAARAAFEAGDVDAAIADAQQAAEVLSGAPARGQQRLVIGGIVLAALVGLLLLAVLLRRRRPAARSIGTLGAHPDAPPPPPGDGPSDVERGPDPT